MKYSVRTVIIAAAIIPFKGINNTFNTIFANNANKVMYITVLKKPIPFSIIPVRLFNPRAIIPNDKIFTIIIDSSYFDE